MLGWILQFFWIPPSPSYRSQNAVYYAYLRNIIEQFSLIEPQGFWPLDTELYSVHFARPCSPPITVHNFFIFPVANGIYKTLRGDLFGIRLVYPGGEELQEMAISPPASPSAVFEKSSSAPRHIQRSSSRMSIGTKPAGGSRASDEDTKTAVKVGESSSLWRLNLLIPPTNSAIWVSCSSAPTLDIDRRGFWIHSATLPTIYAPDSISHQSGCGLTSRPETFRIW